ncbi:MAG: acetate kinase, partial [Methyloglobulus sp.]|nr:acetate kinase [Methyloglobulus sp.]
PYAKEAIELFVYRISREIGSLVAALGGLDALVFTGGIGEHSNEIRANICQQSMWLGIKLNKQANENSSKLISTPHSTISTWVIRTDENLVIAKHLLNLYIKETDLKN